MRVLFSILVLVIFFASDALAQRHKRSGNSRGRSVSFIPTIQLDPSTINEGSSSDMTTSDTPSGHEVIYRDSETGFAFNLDPDTDHTDDYLHQQTFPDPDVIEVDAQVTRISDEKVYETSTVTLTINAL